MSSFSTMACYAALYACSDKDTMRAYARMVAAMIKEKRYMQCDAKTLCSDFALTYGFEIQYHPMLSIIQECIIQGYLIKLDSSYKCLPQFDVIDKENFIDIVRQKDAEYQHLLDGFGSFLEKTHLLQSSREDLSERVEAFINRYGTNSITDMGLLNQIKNDFYFAEYLIECEESGQTNVIDYLNEYTVGLSLSETLIYNERNQNCSYKNANVYLDTGILFRVLGIDSSEREDCYKQFIYNMHQLGMHVKVYEHTIIELIGIVENSKYWIGNPNYDLSKSSETAYYFITHGWTVKKIEEFSNDIQRKLTEDFGIIIDRTPYPKFEDIHTAYEEEICDMIIDTYQTNDSSFNIEEKIFTVNQDARSLFLTQHRNGKYVAFHLNDLKNIFITTNCSLSKVGYSLSESITQVPGTFIPLVMTDVKWGTLIWFSSPAKISSINRPHLVSAAYAAFKPSKELSKKLNSTLASLMESEEITPSQCYFLKANPIAQRLLTSKTANDPSNYCESTPLEILKEIESSAYSKGSESRQKEVDRLNEGKRQAEFELAKEKQKNKIEMIKNNRDKLILRRNSFQEQLDSGLAEKQQLDIIRTAANKKAQKQVVFVKIIITIVSALIIFGSIKLGESKEDSWILSTIAIVFAVVMDVLALWNNKKVNLLSCMPKFEAKAIKKQYKKGECTQEKYDKICSDIESRKQDILKTDNEISMIGAELNQESGKIDEFSIDISLDVDYNVNQLSSDIKDTYATVE